VTHGQERRMTALKNPHLRRNIRFRLPAYRRHLRDPEAP
jgi:hypothetical protein